MYQSSQCCSIIIVKTAIQNELINFVTTFQVVVSLIAGSVIEWIGSSNATIYLASVLGLISAFSASKVFYFDID